MPFYPTPDDAPDYAAMSEIRAPASTEAQKFAVDYQTAGANGASKSPFSSLGGIAGFAGASVLDLGDTVASSLIPGVNRQDLNNKFLNAVGSPGIYKWFDENRGAIEVGSGVAGVLAADLVTRKLMAPASFAMQTIRKIPGLRAVAELDSQYENAVRLSKLTSVEVAKRGAMGGERFLGEGLTFGRLGAAPLATSNLAASKAVINMTIAKGLAHNLAMEGVMAATLHTNSMLYSDELSHNIGWGVLAAGGGALFDSAVASYTLRKIANSETIRRINAGAYDISGLEAGRIHAGSIAHEINSMMEGAAKDNSFLFTGAGAHTDKITSLAIDASELANAPLTLTDRTRALFGKRSQVATPKLQMAQEELNKVTVRGLAGMTRSGFGTKIEGLGSPLMESLVRDPAAMYGIEEIGTTVDNMTRQQTALLRDVNLKNRFDQVQKLLNDGGKWENRKVKLQDGSEVWQRTLHPLSDEAKDQLSAEAKQLHFTTSHTPVTMLEPGEWVPIELGEVADNFIPRRIVKEGGLGADDVALWAREKVDLKEATLGIRSDGELFLPGNGKLENLNTTDMLHMFHVGNQAVRDMAKAETVLTLPKNPNWFQLDMAEQLLKATDNPALVQFPGSMTRQTAQVESFAQKVQAIQKEGATTRLTRRGSINANLTDVDMYKMRVKYNLPRLTSYQMGLMGGAEHPIDILLNAFKTAKDVRSQSYDDLLKGLNDSRKIMGLTEETSNSLDGLGGNSFNFLLDRDGIAIKPIVAYRRPLAPTDWSRDVLLTRQIMKQSHLRDALLGDSADAITREIAAAIESDPNASMARKVMELADDQHRSFVPGFRNAAPQTGAGAAINAVTSRGRRDVDSLTMLAASRLQETKTRVTQALMKNVITKIMGDSITAVNSTTNTASKLLLNQFYSFRPGWHLLEDAAEVTLPKGKGYQFILDHESMENKRWFAQMFDGADLPKGQPLLNPNRQPIVLDELAYAAHMRLQQVEGIKREMSNTLLRSQGLSEIKAVPHHVPPPNLKGKYVGYTFDSQNNVVPGMTVIADTPSQLASMQAELVKSPQWQNGYINRGRDSIGSFMTLWDKAQMDYVVPNTTAIMSKKHNFGKTGGNLLNTQAFDEALVSTRDSMINHGDDIMELLFDDPIKAARARADVAKVESAVGSKVAESHSSIYDRYLQNLLGRNALGAKDSFFGEFYSAAEKRLNAGLELVHGGLNRSQVYQGLKDYLATSKLGDKGSETRFKVLTHELGPYMPFKSTLEMIERETGSKTAPEIAAITAKMSWFEATSRLRWLESMHAVANFGGVIANMPAVIRALQPMAGETLEMAARRNSSLTMMVRTPEGREFIQPNIPKLLWQSMKDAWSKDASEFTQKAVSRGFMNQEVAEFNRQWGSIDSKAGWRGFVFGNEAADPSAAKGVFGRATAKVSKSGGLDKWLGLMSDKSEDFSRAWGMYAGKRVAESMGIHNVDDQIAFAHDITNKVIANYDPRNRPEVFQGALGAMAGLFQSYMLNYYQRMFRYIETKDHRALATQFAVQGGVFGMSSLPGWNALNWAFFDHGQAEKDDPVDSIYHRFDQTTADLLMHGTISNLPKIFGADGMSLYTRGDSQIRVPGIPIPQLLGGTGTGGLPVADTISRVWKGFGQAYDTFANQQGKISPSQLAEIASNVATNRPLSGIFEVFGAHGKDTDWSGQLASETHGLMDSAYRVIGVRSMQQQKEIEAFYANRTAQTEQASRKMALNVQARGAIRAGNFDQLPGLFAQYVQEGGDVRYYSRWLKKNYDSATDTRSQIMLDKALRDPDNSKNAYVQRLLDAQVDTHAADGGDDYGGQAQIDQLIEQGFEATGEPTGNPLDHQSVEWDESQTQQPQQ